jgi:hypothetical protein
MSMSHGPLYDPLGHPGWDRTIQEWEAAGLTDNWWINLVAYSVRWGEARVLLRAGNVLRIPYAGAGPLEVSELP